MASVKLDHVLTALASWQEVGSVFQLHPGDVGWQWRFGAEATAEALCVWEREAAIAAVGFVDGPTLRLAFAPAYAGNSNLADDVIAGVPADVTSVEAPHGTLVRERLASRGWRPGEEWVPLERLLAAEVEDCGLEVRIVDANWVDDRVAVQRAAFAGSTFDAERWRAMSDGPAYASARCLVGYDNDGVPVAAVTVWSAGEGRVGLIEPLGVHGDHRGRGYGRAMTLAAASALRKLGAASALVGTPKANVPAVATYASAGFMPRPAIADLERPTA